MNELFRFGVVRPANVSRSSTTPLSPRGSLSTEFQQQLGTITRGTEGDANTVWGALERACFPYVENNAGRVLDSPLWSSLGRFPDDIRANVVAWSALPIDTAEITQTFSKAAAQPDLQQYREWLADLFLALLVVRRGGPAHVDAVIRLTMVWPWQHAEWLSKTPTLAELGNRLRVIDLIDAGVAVILPPPAVATVDDARAATNSAIDDAMSRTILLPPALFAPLTKVIHAAGFRELHAVRQHVRRYERTEIARIENVLAGETRAHSQKHTLSNETDVTVTTSTTTEKSTELTTADHVAISNEASQQVKEDTKLDAGVHAQYDAGGSYKLQADLTLGYENSTDSTKKFSSNVAKDVTQKAVNKVTQQVIETQTKKIIETFEELESQQFQNDGATNTAGIYQWLQKVYLAQVFNLGRHMLLEIMVPEPGAALLAAAGMPPSNVKKPAEPKALTISGQPNDGKPENRELLYTDLSLDADLPHAPGTPAVPNPLFYGNLVSRYEVTGVTPPPPLYITVSKAFSQKPSGGDDVLINDTIRIDDGYVTATVFVKAAWTQRHPQVGGKNSQVEIMVGRARFKFDQNATTDQHDYNFYAEDQQDYATNKFDPDRESVALAVETTWADQIAGTVQILCQRSDDILSSWQLETYGKIVAGWEKLESDYQSALDKLAQQATSAGPLGAADPDTNRTNERIELKRSCIAIIDNSNATVEGVDPNVAVADSTATPVIPEPILDKSQSLGASVRWFEQAFEWENMAYVLYPYFWGRRTTWVDRLNLQVDDPLFKQFLQAGYARVVVPVRLGFEPAILFYLNCGLPWLGGGLPVLADNAQAPLYLDIADEIRALTGGGEPGETAVPIGEPWEYSLPTGLLMLRTDTTLPEWHRKGLPSDAPSDAWMWLDGPPAPTQ